MMSGNALRDLNTLSMSERKTDGLSKVKFIKTCNGNTIKNVDEPEKKSPASVCINTSEGVHAGGEVANTEVEYIESENLSDLEDVDACIEKLLPGLEGDLIPLVVKSLKNPRSAVCKTAIMTSADIFRAYADELVEFLGPLLVQLLLKSSQDKRFVCEAAERALETLTTSVFPVSLLPKLQPYLKNRNPRIRAKASTCFSRSVPGLGVEGIQEYGIDKLMQVAASQLSDQLPESREAARTLLLELETVYEKSNGLSTTVSEQPEISSWENFCQSKLSPLSAQAVLWVTNVAREGLIISS
ncbi:UDP-glycosyltransferase 90A1-like isoform X1 [Hibiscus syriacus]|uniref:UDP-glycosyltransferase 90A1-like isoform X1 n=1 Tax=Hibiscus syriacus TaxID=106335 RepID=A0A6A2YSV9_HIBSY|nr:UDP-glycosyltransferase 90A1-like isoform X1 [Hibiscus syriacus]